MTQSTVRSFDCIARAKAPACRSKPHNLSPLYAKAEALGFTGHFYNKTAVGKIPHRRFETKFGVTTLVVDRKTTKVVTTKKLRLARSIPTRY